MVDTDSLFPLLDSCSNGEQCYRNQSFVVEAFMAGTPPPQSSNHGGLAVDPSAVSLNAAVSGGQGGSVQLTAEQLRAAEDLLNTPILGDTLADIMLEAPCHANLAERAQLAQVHHNLEARERALAKTSRLQCQPSPSLIQHGRDVNHTLEAGGLDDIRIYRTPIDNIRATTRLADSIWWPKDWAVAEWHSAVVNSAESYSHAERDDLSVQ
jgi:hypothetical protein